MVKVANNEYWLSDEAAPKFQRIPRKSFSKRDQEVLSNPNSRLTAARNQLTDPINNLAVYSETERRSIKRLQSLVNSCLDLEKLKDFYQPSHIVYRPEHLNIFLQRIKILCNSPETIADNNFFKEILHRLIPQLALGKKESPETLSQSYSFLKFCNEDYKINLMKALQRQVLDHPSPFEARRIAMILHSLHKQDPEACKNTILELAKKIEECKEKFSPQQLAMSFYGLKRQDPEVCNKVIIELAKKLKECDGKFSAVQLAMSFYGLFGHDLQSCKTAIQELGGKLKECTEEFNPTNFAMSFHGLSDQDPKASKDIILHLGNKLKKCKEDFNPKQLAMSFYGLKGHDPIICKAVIFALGEKLKTCNGNFNSRDLAMCFYGLGGQNAEACKEVIRQLNSKLKTTNDSFKLKHLTIVLQGAKFHINSLDMSSFYNFLESNFVNDSSEKKFDSFLRQACLFVYMYKKSEQVNPLISSRLERFLEQVKQGQAHNTTNYIKSTQEDKFLKTIRAYFRDSECQSLRIIDGIKMDMYVPRYKLNIQIEGRQHKQRQWMVEDEIRDAYLRDVHRIHTIRIRSDAHENEIVSTIQAALSA